MQQLLEVRDLRVDFNVHGGLLPAVRGISFSIRPATTVALVGESGSGKSVTAQAIMRILPQVARISGGQILLSHPEGREPQLDLAALEPLSRRMRAIRGGRISMIFQEPMVSLSPLHTVGDQVSEALFLHRRASRAEGMELTREMLRLVGFPDPARTLRMYPFELSGGLRQRAMIAMALICHPSLLIADEPTTALDVTIQAQILSLIKDLQRELHMAVLLITHDLGVVANMADEVVVMYHGAVTEYGPVEDIFERPGHPYLRALLAAVPHFDMKPGERLVPVREVQHDTRSLLRAREPWPMEARARPHVEVAGLVKAFGTRKRRLFTREAEAPERAVDQVGFSVAYGESFGLVGESGCGKTTVSKVIMRALSADAGEVRYNDRGKVLDVLALEGDALTAYRRRVQYMFQDPFSSLSPRMTVYDILREPLVIHRIGDADYQSESAKSLMRVVGLDPRFLSRYPHSFSGGQRQRIGIARALALRPDLLICDEPVSALDVSIQAQILNLLKDLQDELGLTYLFISHNLAVVDYVAERIAVMCRGRIVEQAGRQALFEDPRHPYTRALLAAVPYPDLSRRLNFRLVMEGRASEPTAWPRPYTLCPGDSGRLVDVGGGHLVRESAAAELRESA